QTRLRGGPRGRAVGGLVRGRLEPARRRLAAEVHGARIARGVEQVRLGARLLLGERPPASRQRHDPRDEHRLESNPGRDRAWVPGEVRGASPAMACPGHATCLDGPTSGFASGARISIRPALRNGPVLTPPALPAVGIPSTTQTRSLMMPSLLRNTATPLAL